MNANPMQSCIDACTKCYQSCLQTARNHFLKTGGKHVEPSHFRQAVVLWQVIKRCLFTSSIRAKSRTTNGFHRHNLVMQFQQDLCRQTSNHNRRRRTDPYLESTVPVKQRLH